MIFDSSFVPSISRREILADLVGAMVFLTSDAPALMTGQTLFAGGGGGRA